MFAGLVYTLCAITALLCAALLWRAWLGSRARVLFWSSLCFSGLVVGNAILVLDKLVFPVEIDLLPLRLWVTLCSLLALLLGLVYANE